MNRDAAVTVVVAFLAVLAIALGAATLDPVESGGGLGPNHGTGAGVGEDDEFQMGGRPPQNASGGGGSVPPLFGRLLTALAVVVILLGLYGLYRYTDPRELVGIVVGVVVVALVLYAIVRLLSEFDLSAGRGGIVGRGGMKLPGGGGSGLSNSGSGVLSANLPVFALAAFGLVLIGGTVVALRSVGEDEDEATTTPEATADSGSDVVAIGRAAGRAADRIDDDATTGNEVYRAWEEMTDHLDVANPHASTPGEFATAAVDAGMGREDVSRLTDLFRGTRYGGRAITDERESRAVAALRGIEAEYATADAGSDTAVEDGGSTSSRSTDGGSVDADSTDGDSTDDDPGARR